ncbi:hypothetical protein [Natronospora cellulosivora (SeqCode)]
MLKKVNIVLLLIMIIFSIPLVAYGIEISGNFERGERTDFDVEEIIDDYDNYTEIEELSDYFYYNRLWLRLRQQLSRSDYYFIRVQYNAREYQEKTNFDNITYDLWSNYTFRLNDSLRNRFNLDLRYKDYYNNYDNTYYQYRLVYQLDYKYNEFHDYTLYLQRRWKEFTERSDKNSVYDRVSLSWRWRATDSLTITSRINLDREEFEAESTSTNKYGRRFNLGFRWRL